MRQVITVAAVLLTFNCGLACHAAADDTATVFQKFDDARKASVAGDNKTAIVLLTELIKMCTKSPKEHMAHLYSERAFCYLMIGDMDSGIKDLSKAIELDPENLSNYKNRSAAYKKLGQAALAEADLKKMSALQTAPPDPVKAARMKKFQDVLAAHRKGLIPETIKGTEELLVAEPKNPVLLFILGDAQFETGEFKDSLSTFNKLISINKNDRYAFNYRGIIYAKMGEDRKAIADFSKVIELRKVLQTEKIDEMVSGYSGKFLAPKTNEVYATRAKLYLQTNEIDKALSDATQALRMNPRDDDARLLRADIFTRLNRFVEAKADYQTALAINPEDDLAAKRLAQLHFDLGDYDAAAKIASKALALDGDDWRTYLVRASAYEKMHRTDLAAEDRKTSARLKAKQ